MVSRAIACWFVDLHTVSEWDADALFCSIKSKTWPQSSCQVPGGPLENTGVLVSEDVHASTMAISGEYVAHHSPDTAIGIVIQALQRSNNVSLIDCR